jgi:hypothetical protein
VSISGGEPLRPPGETELDPPHGELSVGFGAFRAPLFRDGEAAVRFLELVLGEGVAGAGGTVLALVFTAGFLPAFLDPGAAAVLLAKPVPRWFLLAGKYLGVLAFVALQTAAFVAGTWLALGLRTGYWPLGYLLCVPLLLVHFAVVYSVSVLLAVCTRNTVACVFGSVLVWVLCWGLNCGRHAVVALPHLDPAAAPYPAAVAGVVEAAYWVLPKPADLMFVLDQALEAGGQLGPSREIDAAWQAGALSPVLSVLTSLLAAVGVLAVASRRLLAADY